jgi:hypothetical protein
MFDGADPTKTAREIARSVRKSARLQSGEAGLSEAKSRLGTIHDEMRRLAAARTDAYDPDDRLIALEADERRVRAEIAKLRPEVIALRRNHAAKVRQTLGPLIAATAGQALVAATELTTQLDQFEEINRQLADPLFVPQLDRLGMLVERLARLAGRS